MKLMLFSLAVLACALYLLSRDRKIEFEFEIEPKDEGNSDD
jgi:hypothetical protein